MSDKLTLSASERINTLLDDASFVEIGSGVTARSTDFNLNKTETPGDGVVTGYGVINGKLVYVYSQDASVMNGTVGEMHAKKISALYTLAMKVGAPVIGLIDCAGLRLSEATDALEAFGHLFKKSTLASGLVPQITAVFGNCGGGAGILASLSDFTFMTKSAKLFVNSPNALAENYEEKCDTSSAEYVSASSPLVDGVYDDDATLLSDIRNLVSLLPSNNEEEALTSCTDNLNRTIPNLGTMADDGRAVVQNIADDNLFVETKKEFGKDVVIGLIRLNGATVGVVANQVSGGADRLSTAGATKASAFVSFCDSFGIPVLTLTNVKGFAATIEEEKTIAREAGKLTMAFADATVPKVNVVTGSALGSAYIVMNSKALGADIVFAWPDAEVGAMDPVAAAKIIASEEIASSADKVQAEKDAAARLRADQTSASAAARRGLVDDIIEPDATRKRVIAAFEMLATKNEDRPIKKHIAF